jgi:branched-chain amino acid transport system substrate-binding protein
MNLRRRSFAVGSIILMLGIAGVRATSGVAGAATRSASGAIPIGSTLPLTGAAAPYGKAQQEGFELGLTDAAKALGGKTTFHLIPLDSQADPATAVEEARQLTTTDHVVAIATTFTTPPLAQLPIAARAQVPLINSGGDDPALAGHDWLWNTNLNVGQQTYSMFLYAKEHLGVKKVSIITDNNYTSTAPKDEVAEAKEIFGQANVPIQIIDASSSAPGPALAQVLSSKPDALFFLLTGSDQAVALKALTQQGVKIPVISGNGAIVASPQVLASASYPFYYATANNPPSATLTSEFKARFGTAPNFLSVAYYDAARILGDVVQRLKQQGKSVTGANIQHVLATPGMKYKIDNGTFSFTPQHTAVGTSTIFKFKNGKAVAVQSNVPTSA